MTTIEERLEALEQRVSELAATISTIAPHVRQLHLDIVGFRKGAQKRSDHIDRTLDELRGEITALPLAVAELLRQRDMPLNE